MSTVMENVRKIAHQRDACWSALITILALIEHKDDGYQSQIEIIAKAALERARAGS